MISKRSIFWLALILIPFLIAACSDKSASLGQYHQGRILLLNVLEIDRSDELRYSTPVTEDVVRKWRIQPSGEGNELLLMRFRLENHVALNAVVVADSQAALLEGFLQDEYRPISVTDTAFLDQRGQDESNVTLEAGECTNHERVVVNAGSTVKWTNAGDTGSAIQFAPGVNTGLGGDLLQIAPGSSISNRFDQPGTFSYQCSGENGSPQPAQILVEEANSVREKRENNILFLEGSFELRKGNFVDGWMVFEVPEGTKIRTLRWRAGDSITIRF